VNRAEFDERLGAGVDLVGRTGAQQFEVGYDPRYDERGNELPDDAPGPWVWWAQASYRGRGRVRAHGYPRPDLAVEALARRLLDGGACVHCGRVVRLASGDQRTVCRWRRVGARWMRGCELRRGAGKSQRAIRGGTDGQEIPEDRAGDGVP
jgi:hypothetical protein